jgi:hypothetical protein
MGVPFRLWHPRAGRRLATAAGVVAGSSLIGASLAALNGSVLPFTAWPAAGLGHAGAPVVQLAAPARRAARPLLEPGDARLTPIGPGGPAFVVRALAPALTRSPASAQPQAHGRPRSGLQVRVRQAPQGAAGQVAATVLPAPVSAAPEPTPAPTPPAYAHQPAAVSSPRHGHGHAHGHVKALVAAAPAPAGPAPAPIQAAPAQLSPTTGRQGKGPKTLPPGQAKHAAAAVASGAPPAPTPPFKAEAAPAPAAAAQPTPAPAADAPEGQGQGHGNGHGKHG